MNEKEIMKRFFKDAMKEADNYRLAVQSENWKHAVCIIRLLEEATGKTLLQKIDEEKQRMGRVDSIQERDFKERMNVIIERMKGEYLSCICFLEEVERSIKLKQLGDIVSVLMVSTENRPPSCALAVLEILEQKYIL